MPKNSVFMMNLIMAKPLKDIFNQVYEVVKHILCSLSKSFHWSDTFLNNKCLWDRFLTLNCNRIHIKVYLILRMMYEDYEDSHNSKV